MSRDSFDGSLRGHALLGKSDLRLKIGVFTLEVSQCLLWGSIRETPHWAPRATIQNLNGAIVVNTTVWIGL